MLLAEKARDGHTVARLKWGDAFVFDSGAKEALFLHEQGVPFEVVPGMPAAIGATAYAGVPVTYPGAGDALVLLRGHEGETDAPPDVDWDAARAARRHDRLLRGRPRTVPSMLQALLDHGAPPETHGRADLPRHAAGAAHGHRHARRTARRIAAATARRAGASRRRRGRRACATTCAGSTSGRSSAGASSSRDRGSRRASSSTRSRISARRRSRRRRSGIAPPEDPEAVDRAAASVDGYDWVVFESANAVDAVSRGARARPARPARARRRLGLRDRPSTAERLAAQRPQARRHRAGVPRREHRRRARRQADRSPISACSSCGPITCATCWRTISTRRGADGDRPRRVPHGARVRRTRRSSQDLYRMLLDGQIDAVTFTSPTAVRRFASLFGEEQAADLLNTTSSPPSARSRRPPRPSSASTATFVPDTYTVDGLVAALRQKHCRATGTTVRLVRRSGTCILQLLEEPKNVGKR